MFRPISRSSSGLHSRLNHWCCMHIGIPIRFVMPSFKFAVSQAKCIHLYKNLRAKVQRCCANTYFNIQCLKQGVIPKYAKIKVPYTSPASKDTQNFYRDVFFQKKRITIFNLTRALKTRQVFSFKYQSTLKLLISRNV